MVKVIKRDGQLEDFDLKKIARVLQVAGLDKEAADLLPTRYDSQIMGLDKEIKII